jgi:hypothetical protein
MLKLKNLGRVVAIAASSIVSLAMPSAHAGSATTGLLISVTVVEACSLNLTNFSNIPQITQGNKLRDFSRVASCESNKPLPAAASSIDLSSKDQRTQGRFNLTVDDHSGQVTYSF